MAAKPKLTDEAMKKAAILKAAGESLTAIRDAILEEFGINVSLPGLYQALQRVEDRKRREEAIKKAEILQGELHADAARAVAATMAAADLPEDAKLIQLRLTALVTRSNVAWDGLSDKEKCSYKTWAKLEDQILKYLILKLRLGRALQGGTELDDVDAALTDKLDQLASKLKKKDT